MKFIKLKYYPQITKVPKVYFKITSKIYHSKS